MNVWPRKIEPYTKEEVQQYCVDDVHWQSFRVELKGEPTVRKLDLLYSRQEMLITMGTIKDQRRVQVQTDNYLNALLRGGFLNSDLRVVK